MLKLVFSFLFLLLFTLLQGQLFAQKCGAVEFDSLMRIHNPQLGTYEEHLERSNKWLNKYKQTEHYKTPTVLTIPVIVHIIHSGEPIGTGTNIPAAMVYSQIDVLNQDYGRQAGTPGYNSDPRGADTDIEFCLANVDENGNPLAELGIDRVDWHGVISQGPPYDPSSGPMYMQPPTIWDPTKYMNIWVADLGAGGLLGYASPPGGSPNSDGVVILYTSVGAPPANPYPAPINMGRTATHETGHWLNLRHIWGDANCGDDFCNDTPIHQTANFGCYTHPKPNGCGTSDEMFENYMDYTDDPCMNIFTNDQKDRMRSALTTAPDRSPLLNSNVCNGGDCAGFALNTNATQPTCNTTTGSITASATGGHGPYTYTWSTGSTSASVSSLSPGTYTVTVTDVNTCTDTQSVTIAVNTPSFLATLLSESCSGMCDGSISITASQGTPPYSYTWSNGVSGASIGNLCSGSYLVTLSDEGGCSTTETIAVSSTITVALNGSSVSSTCDQPNGSASVSVSGGTGPYTYHWSTNAGSQTTSTAINLNEGIYLVTVTDANGCHSTDSVDVGNNGGSSDITASPDQSICIGDSINIYATGGEFYVWSTGATTNNINLTPNVDVTYTVSITDAFNCNTVKSIFIDVNTVPVTQLTANPNIPICPGSAVTLTASGGQTYEWNQSGFGTSSVVIDHPSENTTYEVTAYNGGCAGNTDVIEVSMVSPAPVASASATFTTVYPGMSVGLFSTGSVGNTYQWDFNGDGYYEYTGSTGNASTLYNSTGTFHAVLAVTLNGCIVTDTILIEVVAPIGILENIVEQNLMLYPNPNSGSFSVMVTNIPGRLNLEVYNSIGQVIFQSTEFLKPHYTQDVQMPIVADGIYYVRFVFEGYTAHRKFLIQH